MLDEVTKEQVIADIKAIIAKLSPSHSYVSKYGGELIMIGSEDAAQIGGIFAYTEHVTLELSDGALLDNSQGHLEGKGKKRRHLKFENLGDVEAKLTEEYLQMAIDQISA